ncbi:Splicing factor-like protein [Parasponia andersonii]|uniref:Splicing factor-like protein n=1 Tax=Parasponia andersonii TaxID=3476 RepID=A0A2P5DQF8_PARAD|nr:Splicing factor-like protein [Parasponia andersonii]
MAASCLSIGSSSSSSFITHPIARDSAVRAKQLVSWRFPSLCRPTKLRHLKMPALASMTMAVVDGEAVVANEEEEEEGLDDYDHGYEYYTRNDDVSTPEWKTRSGPCELYVCNLPRSCDIPDLVEIFKPFGTIFSVEVVFFFFGQIGFHGAECRAFVFGDMGLQISRNLDTGISRGSGFVTIESIEAAKAAITALDGSDVGGREMRVKFSIHMNPKRRNPEALNSIPVKNLIYESPYKLYIGNLVWSVQPEDLRNHFSRFGNVTSTRVLRDRKGGKTRAYGFVSFSSAAEREAAISLNGEEFRGRKMVVREGTERDSALI